MSLSRGVRLPDSRPAADLVRDGREGRGGGGRARRWRPVPPRRGRVRRAPGLAPAGPLAAVLRLSASLAPGQAATLTDAVMMCVRRATGPVTGVALDLAGAATDIGWEECSALRALHDHLQSCGIRLRLAVANRRLLGTLEEESVISHVGTGSVHPSLHAALLAFYAELPGPGVVTGSLRNALAQPSEPLDGAAGRTRPQTARRPAQPWAPLRPGDPPAQFAPGASPAADGAG